MKNKPTQEEFEIMSKNLNNWKGPLYINSKDPRLFVPKLSPLLGSTFNFGNPAAYLAIIGIIAIISVLQFFK